MSEESYQEGDLVFIEQGEESHKGRVFKNRGPSGGLRVPGAGGASPEDLIANGWAITVIEKAKPPVVLPTEPGYYLDAGSGLWSFNMNGYLALKVNGFAGWITSEALLRYAPFTRLEPVAETATWVVAELERRIEASTMRETNHTGTFYNILRELGATL